VRSRQAAASLFLMMSASAGGAWAHHSVATFDRDHPLTINGTVEQFMYSNPHTWIYLSVPDGKGGTQAWHLEGGAVNMLVRQGWSNKTLQPGMKVKLLIAPRKDGTPLSAEWLRLLELNGQIFQNPSVAK
jgi:hypothetical protein